MWTERPRAWIDGLILATTCGLALCVIVSIGRDVGPTPPPNPQCQEVVVDVHNGEEILAQCPPGHWLDIVDNANVVCRCGARPDFSLFEREPVRILPPPTHRIPQAEPPHFDDHKGIEL
jgi:hypothetical protein